MAELSSSHSWAKPNCPHFTPNPPWGCPWALITGCSNGGTGTVPFSTELRDGTYSKQSGQKMETVTSSSGTAGSARICSAEPTEWITISCYGWSSLKCPPGDILAHKTCTNRHQNPLLQILNPLLLPSVQTSPHLICPMFLGNTWRGHRANGAVLAASGRVTETV